MADRFPLILNTSTNQIQEIPSGDSLDLTGSGIANAGIITAGNVTIGAATTDLIVDGNARVTGILTVGTGSLTLDGPNNLVNVGTALTLGHTQGVQFHTQNLHSEGFEVNQINASGIITATEADINGDLDVDGHTNLDNVSVGGATTMSGDLRIQSASPSIYFTDTNNNPDYLLYNSNGNFEVRDVSNNGTRLQVASTGNVNIFKDLDVNGHTNLDNVSVSGITTMSGNLNVVNTSPFIDLTDTDNNSDYKFLNDNGTFKIQDMSNSNAVRYQLGADGKHYIYGDTAVMGSSNLTVGGNLSVGGVLTYEDVTNVDSVGLITARAGVDLTGGNINLGDSDGASDDRIVFGADTDMFIYHNGSHGVITNTTGNLHIIDDSIKLQNSNSTTRLEVHTTGATVNGTLTATTFSGSGASLTSLPAANLTGTLPAISGANLTGIDTDLVSDTSPQLGGDLDCNNKVVTLNDSTGAGNNRLKIGNAGDLQIFHMSNANYVSGEVDGKDLYVRSRRDLHLVCGNNSGGYRNVIYADNNGTSRLYHPASSNVKLQTRTGGVSVFDTLSVGTSALQSSNILSIVGNTQNQVNIADGSNSSWGLLLTQSQAGGGYHTTTNSSVSKPCAVVNVQADALNFGTSNTMRWTIDHDGHFYPGGNGNLDIGKSTQRVRNLYTSDLHLSNEAKGGNSIDNTWGDYTIQEGESDLFLINNRSGKKYKFNLTEVS